MQITGFLPQHIDAAVALTQAEDWPHTRADWADLLSHGAGVAAVADGRLMGTALWLPQGPDMAMLGMVIVGRNARRQGLGRRLVRAALDQCGPRGVMLFATPDGAPLYAGLGFRPVGEVALSQGIVAPQDPPGADIVQLTAADRDKVIALDTAARGWPMGSMLAQVLERGTVWGLLRHGQLAGFALTRAAGGGQVIGPVVAPDTLAAQTLIHAAFCPLVGQSCRIDTNPADGLVDWLDAQGLRFQGAGTRMLRGTSPAPSPGAPRLFGLVSQAAG